MNTQEKTQEIEALKSALESRPPTFVLAYRGLSVNQVSALRKKVRATSSRYRVVKNRLALRVIKGTPYEGLSPQFEGPTAIAYGSKDPAALAKAIEEFSKDNQGVQIKGGLVDGRVVDTQAIKVLASLPAREVLVARLLSVLNAPMTRLLNVMQSPARGIVRAIDEIGRLKEAPGSAAGETPGA